MRNIGGKAGASLAEDMRRRSFSWDKILAAADILQVAGFIGSEVGAEQGAGQEAGDEAGYHLRITECTCTCSCRKCAVIPVEDDDTAADVEDEEEDDDDEEQEDKEDDDEVLDDGEVEGRDDEGSDSDGRLGRPKKPFLSLSAKSRRNLVKPIINQLKSLQKERGLSTIQLAGYLLMRYS